MITILICTMYNTSDRVVSDIQTQAEGEISDIHRCECCKWLVKLINFIHQIYSKVILKIPIVQDEKMISFVFPS